ncbi:MAG: pyruvate, water dikinase, partial [Candidatus Dependentiae bacterium]|nr:pyruvate, water dikinase [Candidatus Dependentiae bacterium]
MFLYVFLGFLSSFVFVAQCAQEVIAESVNSVGHQYLGCVRALAAHPELQGQFQKIMGWVVEGKKAPKTFEIEAPILIKRLERELSPKEALLIVSFAQSVYQRAKYRRWGKNALIGVGVAGAGVGLGYGVHRYLKKNDIPNEESAARQEESVNVAINKGGALAISSPDALSIGTAVGTSAEQSSMPEKQAEREKRKQKKAGGRPNKRRKHGSLLAIDSGEAEVGQENLLPAEEYHFKADAELHGNKAANLAKLHEFCKKHSPYIKEKTGYELRVPPFVAISSDAVKAFLRGIVGIDLDQLWNERVVGADNNEQRLRAAGEVRALLKQKCNEKSDAITALANFEKMFGEEGQLVDLFLSDERVQQNKVMVRSTGREDTTTLANAGGNTSVPNVAISFTEVFGAIKKVIFSYVSEKSLSQRLDAGDDIRAVPFVPLLMQVMVGEDMSVPEKERFIPRCGVLYTEEQEGGCFYATNKKYFSGITLIQAAYGHNELVVNSLGKVDTFLVDENHTVRQVIRHKPFRLVPGESKKLVKERNKDNSSQKPALLSAAVKALKMVADRLDQRALRSKNNDEKAPQDVEFVVANENGHDIIYLVQARPLVAKQYERKPSYVPLGFFDGAVKVFGEVVGVAGGAVRTVHDKTEALTATTLYGALNSELPRRPAEEKDKIEAVFVEEVAAETSHEANSMALLKKPVICLGSEYEKVLDWLTDPTHDVVFDPQQSCVLLYDKSAGDVPVIAGWCAYPLVRFLSVPEVEGERLAAVIARADGDFKTQRSIGYRELRAQLVVLKNGTP